MVPTGREGLERADDFDAIGQQLSASGSTTLNNVRVDPEELYYPDDLKPPCGLPS